MRLNVRVECAEQLSGSVDRQILGLVHELTTAVVALAGQPFGVLVREDTADSLHHRGTGEVFRCDELNRAPLPALLQPDDLGDVRVYLLKLAHLRSDSFNTRTPQGAHEGQCASAGVLPSLRSVPARRRSIFDRCR